MSPLVFKRYLFYWFSFRF